MSVAKKQPTKKDKKKSPKVSENKKIAKKTDKSISSKKQSVIKNKKISEKKLSPSKSSPKNSGAKESSPKLKDVFLPEQYVVYPSHGVGKVLEIEKREIAGQILEMYVIEFEKEKMTQRVPIEKIKENGCLLYTSDAADE